MPWWTPVFQAALAPEVEEVSLTVGRPPVVHRRGQWLPLGDAPLRTEQVRDLFEAIAPPLIWRRLTALGQAEFDLGLNPGVKFSVHCFEFRGRVGMILRRSPHPSPRPRGAEEE